MADYVYGATPSTPGVTGNSGSGAVTYYYSTDSTKVNKAWTGITGTTLDAGIYYMEAANAHDYKAADGSETWSSITSKT